MTTEQDEYTVKVWQGNRIDGERDVPLAEVKAAIEAYIAEQRAKHGEYADDAMVNYGGAPARVIEAIGSRFGVMVMPWDVERGDHAGPPSLTALQLDELSAYARQFMFPSTESA